jgi:hypothetical protein
MLKKIAGSHPIGAFAVAGTQAANAQRKKRKQTV